jgi:hypothetical protein
MQRIAAFVLAFLLFGVASSAAQDSTVIWKNVSGIVIPGSVVGSGTGAVTGGMLPWITSGGVAHVNLASGNVQFVVRGLVLAAGNPIGTRGDITAVFATLVCDTNGSAGGGNSTLVNTTAVPLSLQGDAQFSGNVGALPAVCTTEPDLALLIRIGQVNGVNVTGPWIAFGAVRSF